MADPRARLARIRDGLTPPEWSRAGAMLLVVVGLNVAGWVMLAVAASGHFHISKTETFGFTTGILACTLGLLFGLGSDPAAEVGLLGLASTRVFGGLPFYAVLSLPILFAAGMSLFDTADGCFMNFAYDWAFARPVRKVYYNLTITGLSVFVAFFIGTVEILGLIGHQAHLTGGFWEFMAAFDINKAGLVIAGIFVVTWAVALAIWRFGQIEEKWDAAMIENTVAASSSREGSAQTAAGLS